MARRLADLVARLTLEKYSPDHRGPIATFRELHEEGHGLPFLQGCAEFGRLSRTRGSLC
jgi:hypothetical protein